KEEGADDGGDGEPDGTIIHQGIGHEFLSFSMSQEYQRADAFRCPQTDLAGRASRRASMQANQGSKIHRRWKWRTTSGDAPRQT
ncbi:MAG: hypothetical protein EA377_14120, partial [Phycisphaerales bacterium]